MRNRGIERARRRLVHAAAAFAAVWCVTAPTAEAQDAALLVARSNQPVATYDLLVHQLLINDPVAFAMQHQKPLKVTKAQRDSLRQYERDLKQQRSPILREAEEQLSRPFPVSAQQFDPSALPAGVANGYLEMLNATLAYAPRVTALFDSTQLSTLTELRASWTPPQPKSTLRKMPFVINDVRSGRTPPMRQ